MSLEDKYSGKSQYTWTLFIELPSWYTDPRKTFPRPARLGKIILPQATRKKGQYLWRSRWSLHHAQWMPGNTTRSSSDSKALGRPLQQGGSTTCVSGQEPIC